MTEQAQTELEKLQAQADKTNAERTGVGTRVRVGQTRGKGSIPISWEAFDTSQPDTLPKSFKQFAEVTGEKDEKKLTEYLIDGFNSSQYAEASDPIGEHIEKSWPEDIKATFRLVVRNYAKMMSVSIDEAVAAVKPGVVKKLAA